MNRGARDGLARSGKAKGPGIVKPSDRWRGLHVCREGERWLRGGAGCLCLSHLGEGGLEVDEGWMGKSST